MVKKEILTARESLKSSGLRSTESFLANSNALNNYHLLYEAMEKPTLNVYNASQMLNRRGIQFPDSDQTPQSSSQQQSKPGTYAGSYDYFDSIDGIPIENTDEELLSIQEMMSIDFNGLILYNYLNKKICKNIEKSQYFSCKIIEIFIY